MYDLNELDQAWNEYFMLDQITPPEYDNEDDEKDQVSTEVET